MSEEVTKAPDTDCLGKACFLECQILYDLVLGSTVALSLDSATNRDGAKPGNVRDLAWHRFRMFQQERCEVLRRSRTASAAPASAHLPLP